MQRKAADDTDRASPKTVGDRPVRSYQGRAIWGVGRSQPRSRTIANAKRDRPAVRSTQRDRFRLPKADRVEILCGDTLTHRAQSPRKT